MNVELKTTIIGHGLIEMLSRNFHRVTEQNPDFSHVKIVHVTAETQTVALSEQVRIATAT